MFSEYKTWTSQLSTLLGDAEVCKFQNKLSSINVTGLDNFKLGVEVFFNLAESKVGKLLGMRLAIGCFFRMITRIASRPS